MRTKGPEGDRGDTGCLRALLTYLGQCLLSFLLKINYIISYQTQNRRLHGDGDRGNPAEPAGMATNVAGFPWDENKCRGTPAGMEQNCAGFPRECSSI